MSDRAAILAAFREYANKPATAHELRAEAGETFSAPPFQQLRQVLQSLASKAELDELLGQLAELIPGADPFRASALALNCGSLIEAGGDPARLAPHFLAALPRHLALAQRASETTFDADPDAHRAQAGLTFLMLATMAVICRKAEYRQTARANPDIASRVESLRDTNREADYVAQVLGFTDDLDLVILAPNEMKGFRVRCDAVASCAHLMTLLQAALIGGEHLSGEPLDPEVVGVATGEAPHARLLHDHARFNFVSWSGEVDNGIDSLITMPVEETPRYVTALDGQRIVLVGPPVLAGRSWDSNFFANIHDALKSRAEIVEVLSEAEVRRWLERIQAAR